MKTQLIQTTAQPASNLIIYFAGWGTPPALVTSLALPDNTDLLICYDYHNLQLEFNWQAYTKINVVAWSMGIWVAERIMSSIPYQQAVAINGSALPMHDQYGIPVAIFQATLDQLTPASKQKFDRRMCGNLENYRQYQQFVQSDFNLIHSELAWLKQQLELDPSHGLITWDKVIIGEQDKIFPVANMQAYWHNRTNIKVCPIAHYPFAYFHRWEQILCQ